MTVAMPDIYEFDSPHQFLRAVWEQKKRSRGSFSLRAWAKKFGFRNNSTLSFLLKGERPFAKKHLPKFVEILGLNELEAEYFEAMVDRSLQKTLKDGAYYERKMDRLRRMGTTFKNSQVEARMVLTSPLHLAIFDMTDLKGFHNSVDWIRSQMAHAVDRAEILDAISRLKKLGFLEELPDGSLRKTRENLFYTYGQQIDDSSHDYHLNAIELAKSAVGKFSCAEAKFAGYSFRVKRADIPKIHRLLEMCIDEVLARFEAPPGEGEKMHQLNVQAFPLSGLKSSTRKLD